MATLSFDAYATTEQRAMFRGFVALLRRFDTAGTNNSDWERSDSRGRAIVDFLMLLKRRSVASMAISLTLPGPTLCLNACNSKTQRQPGKVQTRSDPSPLRASTHIDVDHFGLSTKTSNPDTFEYGRTINHTYPEVPPRYRPQELKIIHADAP
jgi:hypothetical protein